MPNVNVLYNQRARIIKQLEAINDQAAKDARLELTAEEQARYSALESLLAEVNREIPQAEQARDAEKNLRRVPDDSSPLSADRQRRPAGRRYRDLFGQSAASDHGWKSPSEFFATLNAGVGDGRLVPLASMGEGHGSTGGFAVPEEYAAEWLDSSLEGEVVRPRAAVWPMASDSRKVPGWEASDNSSTLFGGFSAEWLGENAGATDSDPQLRLIELKAKKLALFTKASNELVADGLGIDEQLDQVMRLACGFSLDYAFLRGTGAGQPLGVLNAPSLVTVSKEAGQAADSILYVNLTKMFARLHPSCLARAVWLASPTTIPWLTQLNIPIGTSGAHIPVMTSSGGQFEILTRPVVFTEKLPTLGDKGDIVLVDFTHYAVGLRKEMAVERSVHVGWQTDQTGYRCIMRVDGMPTWASPRTPKHGDTLSWAVALQAR